MKIAAICTNHIGEIWRLLTECLIQGRGVERGIPRAARLVFAQDFPSAGRERPNWVCYFDVFLI